MKSLVVGALALALIAGAALAGQAFESASSQPVTMAAPPNLLSRSTMDISQKTVDPAIFDPSHSTPYRSDANNSQNLKTPDKSAENEMAIPAQRVPISHHSDVKTNAGN
jgi:ABC-type transport system substrate-binding protein